MNNLFYLFLLYFNCYYYLLLNWLIIYKTILLILYFATINYNGFTEYFSKRLIINNLNFNDTILHGPYI